MCVIIDSIVSLFISYSRLICDSQNTAQQCFVFTKIFFFNPSYSLNYSRTLVNSHSVYSHSLAKYIL